jgi:hypothetical protein
VKISKWLIYTNIAALSINGIIVWMIITKTFPAIVGILLVIGFFAGAIWLSCLVNGVLPHQLQSTNFYSAPTEKVEAL